jgi:hypothetical protein
MPMGKMRYTVSRRAPVYTSTAAPTSSRGSRRYPTPPRSRATPPLERKRSWIVVCSPVMRMLSTCSTAQFWSSTAAYPSVVTSRSPMGKASWTTGKRAVV